MGEWVRHGATGSHFSMQILGKTSPELCQNSLAIYRRHFYQSLNYNDAVVCARGYIKVRLPYRA